ncbi:DNA replication/repair protein RecF [Pontibacter sp. JAM-7]|uniref:DNA replication/repair protein RecF n=1 Tax=Pontibacter sp. JAM-7 TaxID=3366581 RepID=UPI003AF9A0B3
MAISKLRIHRIRNLSALSLTPCPGINLIYGENGSGKTSVLEAIHLLGLARSFRTNQARHLIQAEQRDCVVYAELDPLNQGEVKPLGIERQLEGEPRIRFAGQDIDLSTLAELLPLQVINADTFQLLEGSPAHRRQFIDWGVFHADSGFIQLWRGFRRVLKQRNSLLKCGKIDPRMRQVWDTEFVSFANALTELRRSYLAQLIPAFNDALEHLLPGIKIDLGFSSGWDSKRSLDDVLAANFDRDLAMGHTTSGPQRADLRVKAEGHSASERLSRGQKKLVVSALKLAQGALFQQTHNRPCVYLIDDLPSELDQQHNRLFCSLLEQSGNQCFITCVDHSSLAEHWRPETAIATFHIAAGALVTDA